MAHQELIFDAPFFCVDFLSFCLYFPSFACKRRMNVQFCVILCVVVI